MEISPKVGNAVYFKGIYYHNNHARCEIRNSDNFYKIKLAGFKCNKFTNLIKNEVFIARICHNRRS